MFILASLQKRDAAKSGAVLSVNTDKMRKRKGI